MKYSLANAALEPYGYEPTDARLCRVETRDASTDGPVFLNVGISWCTLYCSLSSMSLVYAACVDFVRLLHFQLRLQ